MAKPKRLLILFCVLLILFGTQALAERNPAGFFVSPSLPGNQINPDVSYFSLRTAPEQKQTLEVTVVNETDEEMKISVEVNKAFTNANGVIEYTALEAQEDEEDWTEWITIEEPLLTVGAHQSAVARLHLSMPEEPFEGDLLGGILFRKVDEESAEEPTATPTEEKDGGIQIRNVFIYCVAIQLTQSDGTEKIEPEFEIMGARMDTAAGYPALILGVENQRPLIVLGATLSVAVYPADGEQAVFAYESELSMAPHSLADLCKLWMGGEKLESGEYRVEAEIAFGEQTWSFELPLAVE